MIPSFQGIVRTERMRRIDVFEIQVGMKIRVVGQWEGTVIAIVSRDEYGIAAHFAEGFAGTIIRGYVVYQL